MVVASPLNARDAMPEGGELSCSRLPNVELDGAYATRHVDLASGSYVVVTVSDTGRHEP